MLALVGRSAAEFDPLVQEYIRLVRSHDPAAKDFYNRHLNDIRAHHMYDLVNMSITAWPTVEAYDAFKSYWFPANNLLTSSSDVSKPDPEPLIKAYEGKLEKLNKALDASRR